MPPTRRPFPRFVADASHEAAPYGRWEVRLTAELERACEPLAAEAGAPVDAESARWFPDRTWGGRVYVPFTARAGEAAIEYYGWVSYAQAGPDAEPGEMTSMADFTDVTADDNPDWRIDLNDDVVGTWRTDGGRGGDMTLIWGLPLVRGAVAVTAELEGETVDQAPVTEGRFTLVSVDAVHGFGDDVFCDVKLWDRRVRELASESLYADPGDEDEDEDDEEPIIP